MGKRHRARECAVQCLYQWEVTRADPTAVLDGYWDSQPLEDGVREFAETLVRGTVEHVDEVDRLIDRYSEHWRVDRLGLVEKSVLRLAGYELLHEDETPAVVAIDEAIELAKRFSGPEAAQFVNGVLDAMLKNGLAGGAEPAEKSR